MSITTIDDDKLIHFEVLGRGKPIIFIHDFIGSWRYWWPAMQGISRNYRAYALDLWGFGDSTKSKDLYSIDTYVDLLYKFIDKLQITKPLTIVGHGLGGVVGLSFANKYPDQLQKLFLISIPIQGSYLDGRINENTFDNYVSKIVNRAVSFDEVDKELRKIDQEAVRCLVDEIQNRDFNNYLDNCPCPIMLLSGGQDPIVQPYEGNNTQNTADNRLILRIDDCAHYPMLEEKAKFNRLLLEFLAADDSLSNIEVKDFWSRRVR
ncbi:MAG: alpha/beta hydrolase [Chloroflexota bacterium]